MKATIRSPREVIALVCPDQAQEVEAMLVKALQSVPGTMIWVESGCLNWCRMTLVPHAQGASKG